MREVSLNLPLRVLFAVIGAAAILCGLAVGTTEVRIGLHVWPYWPSLLAALVCAVIICGHRATHCCRARLLSLFINNRRPEPLLERFR
jgi:hypothetical protein